MMRPWCQVGGGDQSDAVQGEPLDEGAIFLRSPSFSFAMLY
jgi:hypothetical protein